MGSFVEMEEDLFQRTGVMCRVIPNASTTLVLEAGKVVLTSDAGLDDAVYTIVSASEAYVNSLWSYILQPQPAVSRAGTPGEHLTPVEYRKAGTRGAVITICPSGAGTARKIREILLEKLSIARLMDIFPVGALDDVSALAGKLGKRLRLVVGSIDPGLSGIPYIAIDKVLSSQGLKEIDVLLKGWDTGQPPPEIPGIGDSREEALSLIYEQMHRFTPSLEADEVMEQCRFVLGQIETRIYGKKMPVDVVVRYVCTPLVCLSDCLWVSPCQCLIGLNI